MLSACERVCGLNPPAVFVDDDNISATTFKNAAESAVFQRRFSMVNGGQ